MRFVRSIQWKLVLMYLLVILVAIQVIGFYFIQRVNEHFLNSFQEKVSGQALVLTDVLPRYLSDNGGQHDSTLDLDYLADSFANVAGAEINVINSNSILLATSGNKSFIGQKSLQTEVTRALLGTRVETIKVDPKNGQRYLYLSLPVKKGKQTLGVVYCIAPLSSVYQTIRDITVIFYTGTGIAVLLTAFLIILLSRTITHPIVEITKKAGAMARGDFEQEVSIRSDDEIGQLGEMFNTLSRRLREALKENAQEKDKLEAILEHMSDGVVAIGADYRILLANAAAAKLLGADEPDQLLNMSMNSVIVLQDDETDSANLMSGEHEFTLGGTSGRILHAYTAPFRGAGEERGAVIVLRDVTEQEREDRARRDFVANVSHEIRTPLTTIKSYIEALEDGAIESPNHARKFLSVIHTETDRMVRMVSDLLQLSRLDSGRESWKFTQHNLRELVQNACFRFAMQLQRREVSLAFEVPTTLTVNVDADKLDQVFDNLISNAIKYTQDGGRIRVIAYRPSGKFILVQVVDTGMGIPKEDLPQIFNRFYRVDKARSRVMGGTGLGLSIARQIVEAHGGQIQIDSEEGQGTAVSFTLPVATGGNGA
ncbi:ATP-binding protein [Tumebacillus permanentifrigoris]|uniref:histidine kinase n=1 Tax=Tumebacillus permanentifrigoris TaxID=378543 RepID=A0A316DER5_9BACL|nr:ATP-binding protein [Tumebacillus permanentifrigoris]PWK16534.1 two-component system sensor histidine kinase VicK [Tumebacillus permanentifrigoris]